MNIVVRIGSNGGSTNCYMGSKDEDLRTRHLFGDEDFKQYLIDTIESGKENGFHLNLPGLYFVGFAEDHQAAGRLFRLTKEAIKIEMVSDA